MVIVFSIYKVCACAKWIRLVYGSDEIFCNLYFIQHKNKMEDTEMDVIGVHNLRICHCAPAPQLWPSVVNVVAVVV